MPIVKPIQPITVEAYEHTREVRLPDELEDLLADPDEMRMQALLTRERILGEPANVLLLKITSITNVNLVCIVASR